MKRRKAYVIDWFIPRGGELVYDHSDSIKSNLFAHLNIKAPATNIGTPDWAFKIHEAPDEISTL
jgi:hypothetical protein